MANKNTGITRASVLAHILEAENFLSAEERAILSKMYASVTKPRKPQDGPTKTQMQNASFASALIQAMRTHGEPVTAKWISENVPGIMTSQKAVAVVHAAGDQIVKFYEGRQPMYRLS